MLDAQCKLALVGNTLAHLFNFCCFAILVTFDLLGMKGKVAPSFDHPVCMIYRKIGETAKGIIFLLLIDIFGSRK